jgi:hypothetical protein
MFIEKINELISFLFFLQSDFCDNQLFNHWLQIFSCPLVDLLTLTGYQLFGQLLTVLFFRVST